jgi:hypothetical protein
MAPVNCAQMMLAENIIEKASRPPRSPWRFPAPSRGARAGEKGLALSAVAGSNTADFAEGVSLCETGACREEGC